MILSYTPFEAERLKTLYQFNILDTGSEDVFENIAALAAQICNTKFASISFIDKDRVYFKADFGLNLIEISRKNALCSNLDYEENFIEIPDTLKDVRFVNNPIVKDGNKIRFFAGFQICPINGIAIGHLSVLNDVPGSLNDDQISALRKLTDQVEFLLMQRLEINKLKEQANSFENILNTRSPKATSGNAPLDDKHGSQKEFYENILNNLPTDIAVFDKNHKYLFVNPGAIANEELRKFIIGKDDFEYAAYRNWDTTNAEIRRKMFLEVKNSKTEIRWEDNRKDKDGNPITQLRRLFPVKNASGEVIMVIGFGLDITDRKILEEKQELILKQLSYQNKQLTDFCNIVSHNLRGPLVNLSMLTSCIEETINENERGQMISMLKPVINNLHSTFNELVESIQIKHDQDIKSEEINFSECLEKTLKGFEIEILKSKAEIIVDFSEAISVTYPSKYINSILHNLIGNALKYQSPNRQPIIVVKTTRLDDKIILSIADNGLGLNMAKHKDSIFKIGKVFHKNPNAKGFGLFMTKTQVDAMGGKIWIESEPDKGTTIFVEFINQ